MNFLEKILGKKKYSIETHSDFWNWFEENHHTFYKAVKRGKNIENIFFDKLSPKLNPLNEGSYYLTGMYDDDTAELILTPDGNIKNIVFIEELVQSAPIMPHWKFTALKPEQDIQNTEIHMAGHQFGSENLWFYARDHKNYPDEVDIVLVHKDYNEENKSIISNGTHIFLDNYLGELNFLTAIDNTSLISPKQAEKELIPISKLKDYLKWRKKEFVEKYSGVRYDTTNDTYSSMEAKLKNGRPLIAIVNSTLLEWDGKASHPWILNVQANFKDNDNNGLPDKITYELLDGFENEIMLDLKDSKGYLNIGRQTADNSRDIYFACQDFRKPSKVLHELTKKYGDKLSLTYDIYKDKYWQSFERFRPNL